MVFNEKEQKIIELIRNNNVDLNLISDLLQHGADCNASNGVEEDNYVGSLFSECIFEALKNDISVFDLLKCFVENGLDLDKYGSSIIADLHASFTDENIIEIIKYILDNAKTKLDVNNGIRMFKLESEYLSDSFSEYDEKANTIDTIAFMLEEYKFGNDYNAVYLYTEIIGQTVRDISVDDTIKASNKNYMMVDLKNRDINTFIKCDRDTLCIYNTNTCYINNNYSNLLEVEDPFVNYLKNNIIGSTITKIEFEHTFEKVGFRDFQSSRNVKIYFSNNGELFYKRLTKDSMFSRLINLTNVKKLDEYKTVFLEQCENYLDGEFCVVPNNKARYRIGHNCNITKENMMKFVFEENGTMEDEYIAIDNDSMCILMPYLVKNILDFDRDLEVCDVTYSSFNNAKNAIEELIRVVQDEDFENPLYKECVENFNYFTTDDYIDEGEDKQEYNEFNFLYCKEEVINFLKAFIWYFNDHKKYSSDDNRILKVFRY
jgi:hypothetical protein